MARSLIDIQSESETKPPVLTDYVATRWYRAPEILAGSSTYSEPVDLWSLGCIFGEMLGGKPVFSGASTLNQFEKIIEVLGMPSEEEVDALQSPFINTMLESMKFADPQPQRKTVEQQREAWAKIYPSADENAIDLLVQLMQFAPTRRMKALDGLRHPYCSQFHDADSEILADRHVTCTVMNEQDVQVDVHDNEKRATQFYREMLYNMIKANKK